MSAVNKDSVAILQTQMVAATGEAACSSVEMCSLNCKIVPHPLSVESVSLYLALYRAAQHESQVLLKQIQMRNQLYPSPLMESVEADVCTIRFWAAYIVCNYVCISCRGGSGMVAMVTWCCVECTEHFRGLKSGLLSCKHTIGPVISVVVLCLPSDTVCAACSFF